MTVADVLAMPALRGADARIVSGRAGLDRTVRWVHSAELTDIGPLLRPGDLLLSTGIAMPEGEAELERYARSLAESEAVGLVIELGRRWSMLPAALVAACEDLGLPLVALHREVRFATVAQAVGERIVDEQLAELREADRVHVTFTELSIAEAGPDEILEAVQRLSGSAVVLENDQGQVLDFRSGPDEPAGFLTSWVTQSRNIHLEGRTAWDAPSGWLVTQVGRRERGWGRLLVQSPNPPPQRLVATVERAAAALALHRLHERQRDSLVRRAHHEMLLGLLADPSSAELLRRCELAGFPHAKRRFVGLAMRPHVDCAPAPGTLGSPADDVIAACIRAAHELGVPLLVCEMDHDLLALLSVAPTADADRTVDELVTRVRRRQSVIAGASRPIGRPAEIDQALREAQHVVMSIRPGAAPDVVHRLQDVHLRGLLRMLADDDRLQSFVNRELDRLRENDRETDARLTDTVRALLRYPTSKSEAAASLHLSRSVFYDRLSRAERLLGADLDDPEIRTSLQVALIAAEVIEQNA